MKVEAVRSREAYRELCEAEDTIPLFSQAWWLDVVAGDAWDVVVAYEGKRAVGALPFAVRRRWGFKLLTQPKLTQSLGPWVAASNKSYPKALAHEKDVLGALADGLPYYDYYGQSWDCARQNWLSFYWRGFEQTTRYTYRLNNIGDQATVWRGLQENIRREIRKGRERFELSVRPVDEIDQFLTLNSMTFERQGWSAPYGSALVRGIDEAAKARGCRDCLVAVDPDGNEHAAIYVVRQGDTAYYLMGGGDPSLRNSGAASLLLWEAICNQPAGVEVFDFEGSMLKPIERFFRGFGAQQVPYFRVSRTPSHMLKAMICLRNMVR